MDIHQAVIIRLHELCKARKITPNALSYIAGVPQSTIKSILNDETKSAGIVTIKKLCDGFDISVREFFDSPLFEGLEQEIK